MDGVDDCYDADRVVSVEHEPMHHELWRTASLRVLRADFPATSTCLWHEHRCCTVYVCITPVDVVEHKRGSAPVALQLPRGFVMCRDHSIEPLVHRVSTNDKRVVLVGVEIQQPQPSPTITETVFGAEWTVDIEGAESECVHVDTRSRVDRLHVLPNVAVYLHVRPQTEVVLVALDEGELLLQHEATKDIDSNSNKRRIQLEAGAAVSIAAGWYVMTLQSPTVVMLCLVQIVV